MKMVMVVCHTCLTPTKISRQAQQVWAEVMNEPFVCDTCLKARIAQAVKKSFMAGTQSEIRAQLAVLATQLKERKQKRP